MTLTRRLADWNAESDAFEHHRDAALATPPLVTRRSAAVLLASVLRVAGVVVAFAGIWAGVAIGRSLDGWSRPLGLAAPGWVVVLGAFVSGLVLLALAVVLDRLDALGRVRPGRPEWPGVAR